MKIQNKELKQVSQKKYLYEVRDFLLKEHNIYLGINRKNPNFECFIKTGNYEFKKLCDIPILNPYQEKFKSYGDSINRFDEIVEKIEDAFLYTIKNILVIKNSAPNNNYELGLSDVNIFSGIFTLLNQVVERKKIYREVNEFVLEHKRTGLVASIILWAFNKVILKL